MHIFLILTSRFSVQNILGISPNSFESIMGLVSSTGRKRPSGLELEEKEDRDREEKDLEDDNVEEISPRRLTSCARPVISVI